MNDTVTLAVVNEGGGGEKGCGSESGSWGEEGEL